MPTVAQVLAWDVDAIAGSARELTQAATQLTGLAAALPDAFDSSIWLGADATAANNYVAKLRTAIGETAKVYTDGATEVSFYADKINRAQDAIRSAQKQLAPMGAGFTLSPDGTIQTPPPPATTVEDSTAYVAWQGNITLTPRLAENVRAAIDAAGQADTDLAAWINHCFNGGENPLEAKGAAVSEVLASFTPYGIASDMSQAAFGYNPITDQPVTGDARTEAGAWAAVGVLPFGSIGKGVASSLKVGAEAAEALRVGEQAATAARALSVAPKGGTASLVEAIERTPGQSAVDELFSGAVDLQSADSASQWAGQHLSPTLATLTPSEVSATKRYTGDSFRELNGAMRATSEDELEDITDFLSWDLHGTVADLDSAIGKSVLRQDLGVVRATSPTQFDRPMNELIGTTQTDPGYLSTSVGRAPVIDGEVRLFLRVPEGNHGLYVDSLSRNPDERELVLPRGTQYTIRDVQLDDYGRYVVTADVKGTSS